MRTIAWAGCLLAMLAVAACASDPEAVNATAGGITYKYDGNQLEDASARAAAHCAGFGKTAKLRTTSRQSGENLAIFDCL